MALISPLLQEVLWCPVCHGDLEPDEARSVLRCKSEGREFPVRDGIPMMLVNGHGQVPTEDELAQAHAAQLGAEKADPDALR